jgi:hypothetical protein
MALYGHIWHLDDPSQWQSFGQATQTGGKCCGVLASTYSAGYGVYGQQ